MYCHYKKASKKLKRYTRIFVLLLILLSALYAYNYTYVPKDNIVSGTLKVHFLDVGQADCILIENDSNYMLIDSGNTSDYPYIENYLKEKGIKNFKYVILTHPHEDHMGGGADIINNYKIDNLFMNSVTNEGNFYTNLVKAIDNKKLHTTNPIVGNQYTLGDATFTIISPNDNYSDKNNSSIGIKLTYGSTSFVMCGDGEIESEYDTISNGIDISADVLKCSHHGSDTSTSQGFLKAVKPKYAVISVGVDNKYGHPSDIIINRLKDFGIKVFSTSECGTIIAISNGDKITFKKAATNQLIDN